MNTNSYNYWVSQIGKSKKSATRKEFKVKPKPRQPPVVESTKVGLRKPVTVEEITETAKLTQPPTPSTPSAQSAASQASVGTASQAIPDTGKMSENLKLAKDTYGTFSPNAQHTGSNVGWIPIGTEPSSSDPEHPHVISCNSYGELGCNCRGYIFHKGPEGKSCTHTREFAVANN